MVGGAQSVATPPRGGEEPATRGHTQPSTAALLLLLMLLLQPACPPPKGQLESVVQRVGMAGLPARVNGAEEETKGRSRAGQGQVHLCDWKPTQGRCP